MLVASRGAAGLSRFGNLPENQNSVQEEKKNIQCLKLDLVNIGDKMFSQLSHWSSVVRTEEEWYRLDLQYNNCFLLQPDWILTLPKPCNSSSKGKQCKLLCLAIYEVQLLEEVMEKF